MRFSKFLVVGLLVMIIGALILHLLIQSGVNKDVAYLIQAIITVELNFFLNAVLTWGDLLKRETSAKVIWKWFISFNFVRLLINNPTAQIIFWIFTQMGVDYNLAYFISIVINTPLTYVTSKYLVYK